MDSSYHCKDHEPAFCSPVRSKGIDSWLQHHEGSKPSWWQASGCHQTNRCKGCHFNVLWHIESSWVWRAPNPKSDYGWTWWWLKVWLLWTNFTVMITIHCLWQYQMIRDQLHFNDYYYTLFMAISDDSDSDVICVIIHILATPELTCHSSQCRRNTPLIIRWVRLQLNTITQKNPMSPSTSACFASFLKGLHLGFEISTYDNGVPSNNSTWIKVVVGCYYLGDHWNFPLSQTVIEHLCQGCETKVCGLAQIFLHSWQAWSSCPLQVSKLHFGGALVFIYVKWWQRT